MFIFVNLPAMILYSWTPPSTPRITGPGKPIAELSVINFNQNAVKPRRCRVSDD